MTQPTTEELRTLIEKAAKLMGYSTADYYEDQSVTAKKYQFTDGPHGWNPYTSAHDNAMLRIRAEIDITHFGSYVTASLSGDFNSQESVDYPLNPTDIDKLHCEFLAVLRCAGAILDERERGKV